MIPFGVRTLNIRCRIIIGIQKGIIILTTTHVELELARPCSDWLPHAPLHGRGAWAGRVCIHLAVSIEQRGPQDRLHNIPGYYTSYYKPWRKDPKKELAEPLPISGNNTTSQPIRRLFLYSPLTPHPIYHYYYSITNTSIGITDYLIHIRGLFLYSLLQSPKYHHYISIIKTSIGITNYPIHIL